MRLISNVFEMSEVEKKQTDTMTEFVLFYYWKFWFTTPLRASAARNDLDFMSGVIQYRYKEPQVAFNVLKSCYWHMWYLTPQMITLALTDKELESEIREKMARRLHSLERKVIPTGKPTFPELPFGPTVARKEMPSLL